jgi:two-component system sensor histidine kinase ResE
MAEGHYDVRVPARGEGEIALLASRFNDMAEKVQESNRVLRDFVANVSHDLRTPLTMIAGFSQALLDGTAGPDEVLGSAEVIHEEAVKMQRLVEDLLQLTRLESGLLQQERHPLEVRPFTQRLIDRIERTRGEREIAHLQNLVPDTTPPIEVDETQIERALRNLLDNALQYTPADGTVTVHASPIGSGWVEIRVSDTGSGIPPQDLARVFERFYRSDKSRERVRGNSGLGLAIVREIIEGHGGHVRVQSEVGKGTTFLFTVPQARGPLRRAAQERADEAVAPSARA